MYYYLLSLLLPLLLLLFNGCDQAKDTKTAIITPSYPIWVSPTPSNQKPIITPEVPQDIPEPSLNAGLLSVLVIGLLVKKQAR